MTHNPLEGNKEDGHWPSPSTLKIDPLFVDTNTTMVQVRRSRLQNLLDRVMLGKFHRINDYDYLGDQNLPAWSAAFEQVRADQEGQGHVCDFASAACKSYVLLSKKVAHELNSIHWGISMAESNPNYDDSRRRVEKRRFLIRHRAALDDLRKVFIQRKSLTDTDLRYIRFNSQGKYRWRADFVPDDDYFNWPAEVKFRQHIALLRRLINEIDTALVEYRVSKFSEE